MCGIFGFIGKSKNPELSFSIADALMVKTEIRGEHATGFWSCEVNDGRIFYDKEPVKSSIYAGRDIWKKQYSKANPDILLGHCRFSTMNSGNEKFNKNNHPHVSADKQIALVHNGKVPEYGALKFRYDLRSDCDSEILLGMFESGNEYLSQEDYLKQEFPNISPVVATRMLGLKDIFSRLNSAVMAVAIGERAGNTRRLWLFREKERPLHVVDLRKTLGQVFFCSTADIWRSAMESVPEAKKVSPEEMIEMKPYEVWMLDYTSNDNAEDTAWDICKAKVDAEQKPLYENIDAVPEKEWWNTVWEQEWKIKKLKVHKTKFADWDKDTDNTKVKRIKSGTDLPKVVSRLGKDEELKVANYHNYQTVKNSNGTSTTKEVITPTPTNEDTELELKFENIESKSIDFEEINMTEFNEAITELRKLIENIDENVQKCNKEKTLTPKDFGIMMNGINNAISELKSESIFIATP